MASVLQVLVAASLLVFLASAVPQRPQRKGFSHSPYDTVDFDDADLNPIKEDLNKYWPALRSPRKEYFEFWRFEWEKHGAYTFDIPQLNGTLNYFKSTLDLYHKYHIYELLFKAKITPRTDKTYSDGAIRNALPNDIRENVNIFCKQKTLPAGPLKGKTVSVLTEIHICVDKALKPVKCPQKNGGCGPANYYLKRQSPRSHA